MRSGKREGDHGVGMALIAQEASAGSRNYHVLLAILPLISNGSGMRASVNLGHPELLARLRIECSKTAVVGGADKHEPARGGDRSADVRPAGLLLIGGEILG